VSSLISAAPCSASEPVTEILHGVPVPDPYRWLEDQHSSRTRGWIEEQIRYARVYLDNIPGRELIERRIRELLAVENYDSLQKAGERYFFRKRLPGQEQPCIYMREGTGGKDELLVDPADRRTGTFTAVKPLRVSADGRLLLYEVKEGGERTGTFELLDIHDRKTLSDILPRGYLRGFAFAPDQQSFYYVHEPLSAQRPFYRAAYHHLLGSPWSEDREIFCAGNDERLRLCLTSDETRLGFLVYRFLDETHTDFYVQPFGCAGSPEVVVKDADYAFGPRLIPGHILAISDRDAPNLRVVELRLRNSGPAEWVELVPETADRINGWAIVRERIFVSYIHESATRIDIFDLGGRKVGEIPVRADETVRLIGGSRPGNELLIEAESLTEPIGIYRYPETTNTRTLWAKRDVPFHSPDFGQVQVRYASKDGTTIPMLLMGRRDVLEAGAHPTIMTSYGGSGVSMTPQFSVFAAFLAERGCLFAIPNIRGGSEFGAAWHNAARRRNRQTAYDDFLCAAEWLTATGRADPARLAIFGGSNSGLLVGVALTQRPDLFRAAVCMVPVLDMLRYHLFDNAHLWKYEYGTADDADDFAVLASYSPYHHVRPGVTYPATMIVSGDSDGSCNPLHARKMTARLQSANVSSRPIILDYSAQRGHSPVLPLSERVKGLSDRMAFLCDQLQLQRPGEERAR
jgi:prolyl oligopeptidase